MRKENEVKGCLIVRKGNYYSLLYYYVGEYRITETKSTGISVNEHKKREAERIMNQRILEMQNKLDTEKEMSLLHPFSDCMEKWVEHIYHVGEIGITTAASYRNKIKTPVEYFRERNMMIEKIQPKDILEYYEWALKYGRRRVYREDAPTSLARSTVKDQAGLISSFLDYAVLNGIIPVNPADKVTVPKVKKSNIVEVSYMELEQAKEFLKFVRETPRFNALYAISKIGLYYGIRRSELLGLKWDAIDFEKMSVEIRHTVVRISHKTEHLDNVKTQSSHRYFPLLNEVKNCLLELMEKQKEHNIYSENGYVFLWEDGREYDPDYITKLFNKAIKACPTDIPRDITLHGLRHSCCAILFQEGWDLADVQNWLGHQDIAVTANIYNHVSKKWKNQKGKKIDGFFE